MATKYPPIARFKTGAEFGAHLTRLSRSLGCTIPCDESILSAPDSPLAQPIEVGGRRVGNRFAIHPMEGWDAMRDGTPSELTLRRWRNFGLSGAKLIWGGEAVAVEHAGRANPNQLYHRPENEKGLARLLDMVRSAHRERHGSLDDFMVGLQITHSGRFAHPDEFDRLEPRIVHSYPPLDRRFGVDPDKAMLSDAELDGLVGKFVKTAVAAHKIGFDFVDIKNCHGYLLHELLGAKTRKGRYGGGFENRTRFLREVVAGILRDAPGLTIGMRLSIFDLALESSGPESSAEDTDPDRYIFGRLDPASGSWDRTEPMRLIGLCRDLGAALLNISAATPYYSAHMQRPAAFPPIDADEPRQDPLIGVIRQIQATAACKQTYPDIPMVGTAYSYLQEYLPHVAQAQVREGHVDFIGLGRVALSYPMLPDDVLTRGRLTRNLLCRTFSDCTNGPRMGFISGCFPLDPYYKAMPESKQIMARKKKIIKTRRSA